jgi:hypothetical protein
MAGLVWNPPTSCAWAARVFVSNKEARDHGIKSVGLPSRLARFQPLSQATGSSKAWWGKGAAAAGKGTDSSSSSSRGEEVVALHNVDRGSRGLPQRPVAVFRLPAVATEGFLGPRLRLSLPSFRCVGARVCETYRLRNILFHAAMCSCKGAGATPAAEPAQLQVRCCTGWQNIALHVAMCSCCAACWGRACG